MPIKPVKIKLSSGDKRSQGMYILIDDFEEKYTKLESLLRLIEIAIEVVVNTLNAK